MEFRNYSLEYVFSPIYIALNAAKFLDHEWVDMGVPREFLQQPAQNFTPDESTTRQPVSDSVCVKIEATPFLAPVPGPPILIKSESRVARCNSLVTAVSSLHEFSTIGLPFDSTFDSLSDFTWNLNISTYPSNFDSTAIGGLFVQDVQMKELEPKVYQILYASIYSVDCVDWRQLPEM
ncbi:hypothetical protein B0H19DRAFT_1057174 [Mycena capillaripes]|nr:hypothetical protein B0H19DRAFT_1057174 [Mycena capillaripes]